ncbi:MAG TPA: VCBS repeat-containing protein, partial [Saprospiraceae bacterium]|nr:VCBS repeat-containing protein [Saprospiraceae bacterium]HPI07035.1 VCBS repeat-containing protein [Saprospiraceae bacterium]
MKSLIPVLIILIAPISNAFSQQVPVSPISGLFQATEICNNGLDDDGDGLIDCYDSQDCPCDSLPHDCRVDSMPFNFQVKQEWISPQNNIHSAGTPIVGNLNPAQDSIPEIVVFTVITPPFTHDLLFYKGDGSDRSNPPRMTVQAAYTEPAIADLDRDGNPELFLVGSDLRIYVYHSFNPAVNPPMQLWVTSPQLSSNERNHVYAADFDGDGISELYCGNEVYALDLANPALPALNQVLKGTGPTGSNSINSSFAAELLSPADCGGDPDCNGLEIAAGYAIYSIDLDPNDGDGVQIKIQRNINTSSGQNFSDGFTGVADLNLDGIPEVVVAGSRGGQLGIYAWNRTGYWTFLRSTNPSPGDVPGVFAVANVYDDTELGYAQDWPEILNANNTWLGCFNLHAAAANPAVPLWWTLPTDDLLGYGGLSSFDFDHNGVQELVFKDESSLRILYGGQAPFPSGVGADRNLSKVAINPATGFEFPVIADVDGDDQAEIIVTSISDVSWQADPNFGYLHVFGSDAQNHRSWMPARDIWNQYAYSVVHIEDDLTVPIVQQPGHLEMPAAGSGKRPMNNFSFQAPKYGRADEAYLPTPDLHMELIGNECHGPTFTITLRICNEGSIPFKDSLFITWYRFGNPFSGNAIRGG